MIIKNEKLKDFIGEYMEVEEFARLNFSRWLDISRAEDKAIYLMHDLLTMPLEDKQKLLHENTIENFIFYSNSFFALYEVLQELYYLSYDIAIDIKDATFPFMYKVFTFYLEELQKNLYIEI